jgi:hypothetical protein
MILILAVLKDRVEILISLSAESARLENPGFRAKHRPQLSVFGFISPNGGA